jgi:hypothetical protein
MVAGHAQQFAIDWFKISSGAGVSSNAQFTVTGAVGQHDNTDTLAGGNFTITGGFWSLIAPVQTAGAPLLSVAFAGPNSVLISWPAPSAGFVLQQSPNLGFPFIINGGPETSWTDTTNAVTTTPVSNQVLVPFSGGSRFYRLISR